MKRTLSVAGAMMVTTFLVAACSQHGDGAPHQDGPSAATDVASPGAADSTVTSSGSQSTPAPSLSAADALPAVPGNALQAGGEGDKFLVWRSLGQRSTHCHEVPEGEAGTYCISWIVYVNNPTSKREQFDFGREANDLIRVGVKTSDGPAQNVVPVDEPLGDSQYSDQPQVNICPRVEIVSSSCFDPLVVGVHQTVPIHVFVGSILDSIPPGDAEVFVQGQHADPVPVAS